MGFNRLYAFKSFRPAFFHIGIPGYGEAFDRVDNYGLVFKLSRLYGVSRSACRLIHSYLVGRSQFICFSDMSTDIPPVKSGVLRDQYLGLFCSSLLMTCVPHTLMQMMYSYYLKVFRTGWTSCNQYLMMCYSRCGHGWMRISLVSTPPKLKLYSSQIIRTLILALRIVAVILNLFIQWNAWVLQSTLTMSYPIWDSPCGNFTIQMWYCKEKLVHDLIMPNLLYCLKVYSGTSHVNMDKIYYVTYRRYIYSLRTFNFLGFSFSNYVSLCLF